MGDEEYKSSSASQDSGDQTLFVLVDVGGVDALVALHDSADHFLFVAKLVDDVSCRHPLYEMIPARIAD